MIARVGVTAFAVTIVLATSCWSASPAAAQPNVTVSVQGNDAPPSLEFHDELPGTASQIQVTVANAGPDGVELTVAGQDLVVSGGCSVCDAQTRDAADLIVMTLDLESSATDSAHWHGTPRELVTRAAALGVVPGGTSSTLTITEALPMTVRGGGRGDRMSMALSFNVVDMADGSSTQIVIPPDQVLGTSIERPGGNAGLALTGADIARVFGVGVALIATGTAVLALRRRLRAVQ